MEKYIVLESNDHKTELINSFYEDLSKGKWVDVILSCEGKTIKAHQIILSYGSNYFKDIFLEIKDSLKLPVIIVNDMNYNYLEAVIDFLYCGEIEIPIELLSSFLKSVQYLNIKGLKKYFDNSISVSNNSMFVHGKNQTENQVRRDETENIETCKLTKIKNEFDKMDAIKCNMCERFFLHEVNLKRHIIRTHSEDQKKHLCTICLKKYWNKCSLLSHIKSHN